MIIDSISDLHGFYPELEGGDLLIVAGDLTARHTYQEYINFRTWFWDQEYNKKVFIAGNHDPLFQNTDIDDLFTGFDYLCDSGTEFEGLKIWGSPWTLKFPGMNPACMAFTVDTEEELAEKWALIPDDVNILVTHSPPYCGGIRNPPDWPITTYERLDRTIRGERAGSRSLNQKCDPDAGLRLHVFGHIHEGYGHYHEVNPIFEVHLVNASHVNEHYKPVNKPIRVIL
jgi:Icc-related predicted phosphoesterase